ncbi:flagellar FlbD family protein [Lutibacter sp. B2]|nr:flagellar FlbD family protein [Lutibacter sp. B2]
MICLKRLNGKEYIVNSDLIEFIESKPDTTITLTTGKKIIVLNSTEDIIEQIVQYKRKIFSNMTMIYDSSRNEV